MLYKFDNDKYELCKKYIMEVYDGNKKNVEMYDVSKSIIVSGNSVNDFMDAADYDKSRLFEWFRLQVTIFVWWYIQTNKD